jgi:hypothetical protein
MGAAPAFASVGEAIEMARAALGYLAAVDATQLAAETQAACLRGLERTNAVATAARASFLSAFTTGKGYSADADYSARVWLMHKTGITRGAAASHTAVGQAVRHASASHRRAGRLGAVGILRADDLPVDRPAAGEIPGGVRRAAGDGRGGRAGAGGPVGAVRGDVPAGPQ